MNNLTTRQSSEEIPYGYCYCGCGQKTKIATRSNTRDGKVKGHPLKYLQGHNHARRYPTIADHLRAGYNPGGVDECWGWQEASDKQGYGRLYFRRKLYAAHRVAWMVANSTDIPSGMYVCHSCDNPSCVNPDHLWLGTDADNLADKINKGRQARGERVLSAKLTEADIPEIFRLRQQGLFYREIAKRFNVTTGHIGDVLKRKVWAHVEL